MANNTSDSYTTVLGSDQNDFFLSAFQTGNAAYGTMASGFQSPSYPKQNLDYFKMPMDPQTNAPLLTPTDFTQTNSDLDQFLPDANLSDLSGVFSSTLAIPGQLDPRLITHDGPSAFGLSNMSDLFSGTRSSKPLELSTKNLSHVSGNTSVHHGQVTPDQSLSSTNSEVMSVAGSTSQDQSKKRKAELPEEPAVEKPKRGRRKKTKTLTKEEQQSQRERFLERNRNAAAKCRINKKQWQENLKESVKTLSAQHAQLNAEYAQLQHEYDDMRAFLVNHSRECPSKDTLDWVAQHASNMFGRSSDAVSMTFSGHAEHAPDIARVNEDYTDKRRIAMPEKTASYGRRNSAPSTPSANEPAMTPRRVQSISFPSVKAETAMNRSASARSEGRSISAGSEVGGFESMVDDLTYFDQMH